MSRWIMESETIRLSIPNDPEQWVEIKKRLSVGDQDDLKDRLIEVEMPVDGNRAERRSKRRQETPTPKARYRLSTVVLLVIAITDWSFLDSKGQKIPVTEANIARMDPWLAGWLEDQIGDLNPLGTPAPKPTANSSVAN